MQATEQQRSFKLESWSSQAPWILILLSVSCLTLLGLVVLYSASQSLVGGELRILKKQIIWLGISVFCCFLTSQLNLSKFRELSYAIYGITILALVLVMVPGIGVKVNGAQRWIGLGPVRLQVSEFAKLSLLFMLAHYLAVNQRNLKTFIKGFVIPVGILGTIVGLVFIEPDFGTAFLCATVGFSMLFIAGARLRYLIPTILTGMALFSVMVYFDPVRKKRILSYLDIEGNISDGAYQLWQAILAFGAGGTWGKGLGQGRQQLSFLPEAHTDFIFAVMGFIATGIVVFLFATIAFVTLVNLRKSPDMFQFLIVYGALMFIALQALINIGVVTGCLPTKGMSLPFISYGGSNLVAMFILIGIFINAFNNWNKTTLQTPREL